MKVAKILAILELESTGKVHDGLVSEARQLRERMQKSQEPGLRPQQLVAFARKLGSALGAAAT